MIKFTYRAFKLIFAIIWVGAWGNALHEMRSRKAGGEQA